jgi:hypothetical protein
MSFKIIAAGEEGTHGGKSRRINESKTWLSVLLGAVDSAATFAENGAKISSVHPDFYSSTTGRVLAENVTLSKKNFPTDDADKVQDLYTENIEHFLDVMSNKLQDTGAMKLMKALARSTVTLPIGQMMIHQTGFASWDARSLPKKWDSDHSTWFTALVDEEDSNDKDLLKANVTIADNADWSVVVTKCVCGILNIDGFAKPSRPGFEVLTNDYIKPLCSVEETSATGDKFQQSVDNEGYLGKQKCRDIMAIVTKPDEGMGRDKLLPDIIQRGFRGWILKKDETLERQIVLGPLGKKSCVYWNLNDSWFGMSTKNYELVDEEVSDAFKETMFIAFRRHVVGPLSRSNYGVFDESELLGNAVRSVIRRAHDFFWLAKNLTIDDYYRDLSGKEIRNLFWGVINNCNHWKEFDREADPIILPDILRPDYRIKLLSLTQERKERLVEFRDNTEATIAHVMCQLSCFEDQVELLLELEPNLFLTKDHLGFTPLHYWATSTVYDVTDNLFEYKVTENPFRMKWILIYSTVLKKIGPIKWDREIETPRKIVERGREEFPQYADDFDLILSKMPTEPPWDHEV